MEFNGNSRTNTLIEVCTKNHDFVTQTFHAGMFRNDTGKSTKRAQSII